MMHYREPINVSDIVSELRRLWAVPFGVAVAMGLLFVVLSARSGASFEQRVDIVGTNVTQLATSLQIPSVVENFDADVVARQEQSKLETLNRESGPEQVRVLGTGPIRTLSIFGTANSREAALSLAKSYAGQVVDAQRADAAERLKSANELFQGQLATIQQSLDAEVSGDDSEHVLLLVDRASTVQVLAGLSTFQQIADGGVHDPEVIGAPAEISRSSLGTYAVLGALLGLVLGSGFVVLRRMLSSAVFGEADLARHGSTVPVLADITSSDGASKGVFAALASACGQSTTPGRVQGVLFSGVGAGTVPNNLPAGVLEALPEIGLTGSTVSPGALATLDPAANDGLFHVVVVDDGIRESSAAIACAGRLASTVVVVRRRKTSIASALEAIDLIHQADGQLRGLVIVD
jgi:hypothetical protein